LGGVVRARVRELCRFAAVSGVACDRQQRARAVSETIHRPEVFARRSVSDEHACDRLIDIMPAGDARWLDTLQ
jgi:hypothetical protein